MGLAIVEHIEHPFGKSLLTASGVQWSDETTTTTANSDTTVAGKNFEISPTKLGKVIEVEFGLTAAFRAVSSATADIIYKWQVRNKGGSWTSLLGAVTKVDIGTTYVEETVSGRFELGAEFNDIPFEIRLLLQCNEANEGRGKIKNSSYVRVLYHAS